MVAIRFSEEGIYSVECLNQSVCIALNTPFIQDLSPLNSKVFNILWILDEHVLMGQSFQGWSCH